MKLSTAMLFTALALCGSLSGQAAQLPQTPTFHLQGTVTDPLGAVIPHATVTFDHQGSQRVLTTDAFGMCKADLPVGAYTMTVVVKGFKTYRRPLFHVSSPMTVVFDAVLQIPSCGDMVIANSSGEPPTAQQEEEATRSCRHEDRFPALSSDGLPFEVAIYFGTRTDGGDKYTYDHEAKPYEAPVFVLYNLFSVRADKVVYDVSQRVLQASGHVIVQDENGERHPDSLDVKLDRGRAMPIQ